ncbi:PCNA-associated factor isoform X2 [Tamandua tetradactyla]|uniref:PCNA-associated factor isoform X2 n=1 Tax=Tamandua tetradactyla TaxID=48850 RepID=UPI004053CA25
MDCSATHGASRLSLVDTSDWSGGVGAEPIGAAARERRWRAREGDQYKRWREIRFLVPYSVKYQRLASQFIALISRLNMVRTKADSVPGAYRKVVASRAPRKVLGSSNSATNSTSLSSRKAENKYAGGNPVCVRPTPKWQKGIGEFFGLSPKDSEKENLIPEEAGTSGLGKAKRKKFNEELSVI